MPDKDVLFNQQAKVWGSVARSSPVVIDVLDVQDVQQADLSSFQQKALSYVLFPFRDMPGRCLSQASFELRVRYPKALGYDVEMTVWALVNFGGLGTRTRRRCGSLLCKVKKQAGSHSPEKREWPVFPQNFFVRRQEMDPRQAWKKAVSFFRQGVRFA